MFRQKPTPNLLQNFIFFYNLMFRLKPTPPPFTHDPINGPDEYGIYYDMNFFSYSGSVLSKEDLHVIVEGEEDTVIASVPGEGGEPGTDGATVTDGTDKENNNNDKGRQQK